MCDLDLGKGHYLTYYSWNPNRDLNPQWKDVPDIDKCGGVLNHLTPGNKNCAGSIMFDGPLQEKVFPNRAKWTVQSWEPLTLTPSIQCSCGDHGFITEGKWVAV